MKVKGNLFIKAYKDNNKKKEKRNMTDQEYSRWYYQHNRERILAYQREYNEKKKEENKDVKRVRCDECKSMFSIPKEIFDVPVVINQFLICKKCCDKY